MAYKGIHRPTGSPEQVTVPYLRAINGYMSDQELQALDGNLKMPTIGVSPYKIWDPGQQTISSDELAARTEITENVKDD